MSKNNYCHKDFRQQKRNICNECLDYCKEILKYLDNKFCVEDSEVDISYHLRYMDNGFTSNDLSNDCKGMYYSAIDENGEKNTGTIHYFIYNESEDVIKALLNEDKTNKIAWTSNLVWDGYFPLSLRLYKILMDYLKSSGKSRKKNTSEFNSFLDTLPDEVHFPEKLWEVEDLISEECKKLLKDIGCAILLKPFSSFCTGKKFPQAEFDHTLPCEIYGLQYNEEYDSIDGLLCCLEHDYKDWSEWRDDIEWNVGHEAPYIIYDMIANKEYITTLPKEFEFEWNGGPDYTTTMNIIDETFCKNK